MVTLGTDVWAWVAWDRHWEIPSASGYLPKKGRGGRGGRGRKGRKKEKKEDYTVNSSKELE